MKQALANVIQKIHSFILFIALAGWLVPLRWWLQGYLVLLFIILLQWLACHNQCVLTIWENRLRTSGPQAPENTEQTFIGRLLSHLCGWRLSDNIINLVSYAVIVLLICTASVRLLYDF